MIETTWSILDMKRKAANGGVFEVRWQLMAKNSEGPESAVYGGESKFEPDPTAPDYTPFESLTQEQVLAWVWATEDKDEIESDRIAKVEAQIERNNADASGLPWEPAPELSE